MSEAPKIAAARIEVERAKAELLDTARQLQQRLQPKTLASDAWENVKSKGADLAEDAVDAVAKRPVAVGSVIAALAMYLAREPLKKATVKFYDVMTPLFEPREPKSKSAALKPKTTAKRARSAAKQPAGAKRRAPAKKTTEKA